MAQDKKFFQVHMQPLAEIAHYLDAMRSWPTNPQISTDAARALTELRRGNNEPAKTFLIRWYQTLRQGADHTLNENCAIPLFMEEVLISRDRNRHLDLLIQMMATLGIPGTTIIQLEE